MARTDLFVAGTGTFAAEIAEIARDAGHAVAGLVELLDDERVGSRIHDLPVVAPDPPPARTARFAIGVGGDRGAVAARLAELGWEGASVVHPTAHVTGSTTIAPGAVVAPGVVVGAEAQIGEHALLGRGALVGHHTRIGTGVTVNPGANIAGNCVLGDRAVVGMGAVVVPGVTIGAGAIVAAGAVVLSEVAPGERVQGVPAKVYRGS